MSTPIVPPRPQRTTQQTAVKADQPIIPPRPVRRPDPDPSPDRYSQSPLNLPHSAHGSRATPKRTSQDLPRRPPSVAVPDVGQEGSEYSSFDLLPAEAHGVPVDEQKRNVAADLPIHQPKASVPQSTATKNISRVTGTDSTSAAAAGIGRARPADDVHKQPPADVPASPSRLSRVTSNTRRAPSTEPPSHLRSKASFTRSPLLVPLERTSSRPGSVHGDDFEHGIPEIGTQIPLNRWAGDAQAPTPGAGGQSAFAPGIGFFNDGSSKNPHKKRHSRQEFGPPDSYGIRHAQENADQFEKEWIKKHPQEAAKEEFYQHLPKPETALSSEQLNRLVHANDGTLGAAPGTPGEDEAIDNYLSRVSSAAPASAPESPVRKSFASRRLHPDSASHDEAPSPRKLHRYDSEEEHSHYDGTPILAADEIMKRPTSSYMQPAVVPEPRDDDYYYDSDHSGHGSRRESVHVPSRPSSRPGSVHSTHNMTGYGGGSLHRFISHEEVHHSGTGTPLEEIEEYEPLFPDDEGSQKKKPKVIKHRPDLAAMHHFPSQDVWEDTPSSLQYSATVSTPELERQPESLQPDGNTAAVTSTFETPEQEQKRQTTGPDMTSDAKTFMKPQFKPGVMEEFRDHHRPAAHRFPSADVWEDTPSSMLGETTVSIPEMDDTRGLPEERATTAAMASQQDDQDVRSTTAGGLNRPSVPSRPQKRSNLAQAESVTSPTEETSPTRTKAPSIPTKPNIPARPSRPSRSEEGGAPLGQSRSGDQVVTSPPLPKAKPAVPARPGAKISSVQANFMNDLNNRLKLGPQGPPAKKEEEVEEQPREPLVDARKSRAKGPPRRKPATSPASDRKSSATFAMSPLITCWTIDESDELRIQNDSEKENADPNTETASDAPKVEKLLETNDAANTGSAAPAGDVAAAISQSKRPSNAATEYAQSADALKAALAEAGAGPAVESVQEEEAVMSPPAVEEHEQSSKALKAEDIPGAFIGEKDEVAEGDPVIKETREESTTL